MSTYYATKSYIVSLTRSISEELKIAKSNVKISALCPGPVNTNFNNVANVKFALKGLPSEYVAKYAIDKLLQGKKEIIPGWDIKVVSFFAKLMPTRLMLYIIYKKQNEKAKE